MRLIVMLCIILAGCSPGFEAQKHIDALNSLWTGYFLANGEKEKHEYLVKIDQQIDRLASETSATNRMVLHQRFLFWGTKAVEALEENKHAAATEHGLRAFDAWLLFDPASPELLSAKEEAEKLRLVVERVSALNKFSADLARESKEK